MMRLRPSEIMFSQESINNYFDKRSMHRSVLIGETLDGICEGRCNIYDIPTINVMRREGKWVTADNRRLWVFRELERLGKCVEVPVRETFYINPNKLNSFNGGVSVRVRRYPGGQWHKKPSAHRPKQTTPVSRNFRKRHESQEPPHPVIKTPLSNITGSLISKQNINTMQYLHVPSSNTSTGIGQNSMQKLNSSIRFDLESEDLGMHSDCSASQSHVTSSTSDANNCYNGSSGLSKGVRVETAHEPPRSFSGHSDSLNREQIESNNSTQGFYNAALSVPNSGPRHADSSGPKAAVEIKSPRHDTIYPAPDRKESVSNACQVGKNPAKEVGPSSVHIQMDEDDSMKQNSNTCPCVIL